MATSGAEAGSAGAYVTAKGGAGTVRALVKTAAGAGNMAVVERPAPVPGPGEVLLEMVFGGLCHTDIGMISGAFGEGSGYRPAFPLVMGHEYLGRVVGLGEGVDDLPLGTRVVGGSHLTCRRCRWCAGGRSMLCETRKVAGLDVDGGFAERYVLPRVNLVAVPDHVPDRLAALAEPFAVAAHAVDLARPTAGERVAVVGPGTVGLLTLGALAGTDVTVVGRRADAEQLRRATEFGAARVATGAEADSLLGEFDVVFETAGTADAVSLGARMLGPGGRLVCVGLPADEARISSAQLAWQERSIIGSRAYDLSTWAGIPERLAAAPELERIVSHEVPLRDFERAIDLVESREATKVLLRP